MERLSAVRVFKSIGTGQLMISWKKRLTQIDLTVPQ